jgi:phage shock protein A
MGILTRISRIFKAEANSVVDKMENETKIADQIIRDLYEKQSEAIKGFAEVKATAAKHRADEVSEREKANEWEKKTNDLLDLVDSKGIEEIKGNQLAQEAAEAFQTYTEKADSLDKLATREESALKVMEAKIKEIKKTIEDAKNQAEMIKAKSKTADAEETINKTLSSVDIDGLKSTLERMKEKADAKEFRAQAYADIDSTMSSKQEIDAVLSSSTSALDKFKSKRNKTA